MRSRLFEETIFFEELEVGDNLLAVEADVKIWFYPGEPMVRYYPDGSGYPGSPDEFETEIIRFDVREIYDAYGDVIETFIPDEEVEAAIYAKMDNDFLCDKVGDVLYGDNED